MVKLIEPKMKPHNQNDKNIKWGCYVKCRLKTYINYKQVS